MINNPDLLFISIPQGFRLNRESENDFAHKDAFSLHCLRCARYAIGFVDGVETLKTFITQYEQAHLCPPEAYKA